MPDSEDWRRRRAEELGLVDRPRAPAAIAPRDDDGIAPMRAPRRPAVDAATPTPPVEPLRVRPPAPAAAAAPAHQAAKAAKRPSGWAVPAVLLALVTGIAGWAIGAWTTAPVMRQVVIVRRVPVAPPPAISTPAAVVTSSAREPVHAIRARDASTSTIAASTPTVRSARKGPRRETASLPRIDHIRFATAPEMHWRPPVRSSAAPGRGFRPSFDCRRAIAAVNRMICADPELARLDVRLSQAFSRAIAGMGHDAQWRLDAEQARFLNRRGRCTSPQCIDDAYRRELDTIDDAGL